MPQPQQSEQASSRKPNPLPIAAPERRPAPPPAAAPDLHVEEIEERHIPKDRNIFDK